MEFTIENEYLQVRVNAFGAELTGVVCKADGVEHIWEGDPALWGDHAPILFPYTGRLKDGKMEVKGRLVESGIHGFAKDQEHTLVCKTKDTLVLQLTENAETLAVWPYKFRLLSAFALDGNTLRHSLTVENRGGEDFSFGIGFHPGFRVPFDGKHTYEDYELRFSHMESPLCASTPNGLLTGQFYYLGKNIHTLALDETLFANDSHCMLNLTSKTLGLYEKDSGRAVICDIGGFPYTLIWSEVGAPRFVCIEPWHSLPGGETDSYAWEERAHAATLAPGETWSTTMCTSYVR